MDLIWASFTLCVIVWMLGLVYWKMGWAEIRGSARSVLVGFVVFGSVGATEPLAHQVCRLTRQVTATSRSRSTPRVVSCAWYSRPTLRSCPILSVRYLKADAYNL